MPNPFAHIELTTDNLKAAIKFYGKVFAWKLTEMPGMNYTMIDVGGGTGGGMQLKPMDSAATGWMPYVQVDDVKATLAKATKAGGTALLPYQEIGEMGAIGVFADPQGAAIGVWQAKASATAPPVGEAAAAPTKKAVAKPTPATKRPAKTGVKAQVKGAPVKKESVKGGPAKKAPVKAPPAKKAPAKKKKA